MKWEVGVSRAETGDKMVFENADGAFCLVASVGMWWYELVVNLLFREEFFEKGRCFVVEALQLWAEAARSEDGVNAFEGGEVVGGGSGSHGLREYHIAVVVVDDEDVVVAVAGRGDKTSGLVAGNASGDGFGCSKDVVTANGWVREVGWCSLCRFIEVIGIGDGESCVDGGLVFGSAIVAAGLIEVTFVHRYGLWWVAADVGRG